MKWIRLDIDLTEDDFVTMIKLEGKKLCLVKHQNKFMFYKIAAHMQGVF